MGFKQPAPLAELAGDLNRLFMKLLVTGGAGFIGSNFIHYWLKKYPDDKIVNLDILTYAGNLENLRDIENNILLIVSDYN